MGKVVVLDRDGVININNNFEGYQDNKDFYYILKWKNFVFAPGAKEAISRLAHRGHCIVLITIQKCISKGLITLEEVEAIHTKMRASIREYDAKQFRLIQVNDSVYIYRTFIIPATDDKVQSKYNAMCSFRRKWSIRDIGIGDSADDIVSYKKAGIYSVHIKLPHGDQEAPGADMVSDSLANAVDTLIEKGLL